MKLAPILPFLLLAGCAGSRRSAEPPPARPAASAEISVIPRQELKGNRPFMQYSASVGMPDNTPQLDPALEAGGNPMSSDDFAP